MTVLYCTHCVICHMKAKGFGGHVHRGDETIVVGFCDQHFQMMREKRLEHKGKKNCKGCYGTWNEKMGVKEEYNGLFSIDGNGTIRKEE